MSKNLLTTGISCSGPFTLATWPSETAIKIHKEVVLPEIDQVIFQKNLTIVVWADKVRTIVKCSEEDFDEEKGLAMAIAKRFMERNKFKRLIEKAARQNK